MYKTSMYLLSVVVAVQVLVRVPAHLQAVAAVGPHDLFQVSTQAMFVLG
jgi:hypothetical protein